MSLDVLSFSLLSVLFLTGLVAGAVDAIAGGGGLITVPALLSLGVPPHIALGTNKLQSTFGTAVATYNYHRSGWLTKQGLLQGLIFSFIGAVAGSLVGQIIQGDILKKIIPFLLLLVLIYTIFTPRLGKKDSMPKMSENIFYLTFGTLMGFYDGFLGPGVGSFRVFLLIYFLGHNLVKATAYTKAFNLNTNITALICFAIGGNVNYKIGLCMALGQIIGGKIGAELAIRKGVRLIRPIFIVVVACTIAILFYQNYIKSSGMVILFQKWSIVFLILSCILGLAMIYIRTLQKRKKTYQKDL